MGTKTSRHTKLVFCVLFFVMAIPAYGGMLIGPVDISTLPPNPTSQDTIAITVSGEWSDSCIPNASYISMIGKNIHFEVFLDYTPGFCWDVISGWQQTQSVGPLSPGVYTLHVDIGGFPPYLQTTQFTVSGPTERNVPNDYSTIQAAINASNNNDVVIVAPGTYTGDGNRDIDFLGKAITVRSTDPNDPCIVASTIIDCQNTNHQVFKFISNEGRTSILEGLTITDANIQVMGGGGAGLYIYGASPTINKCVITNNHTQLSPGCMCISMGGGIFISIGSNPLITNCIITGNSVGDWGGGISCFTDPSAQATVRNCLITNNTAGAGGGVCTLGSSSFTISNCTIANNSASGDGGAVLGFATIKDSIIWANTGINQLYGSPNITYSDVQGGYTGTGNINADPCFVSGPLGNYCLSQTAAGQAINSPCINAGSDYSARIGFWDSSTRTDEVPDSGIVDMGYHRGSYNGNSPGNINNDCVVDMVDFAILASQWQQTPGNPSADIAPLGGNGIVNIDDLALLAQSWLWTCSN